MNKTQPYRNQWLKGRAQSLWRTAEILSADLKILVPQLQILGAPTPKEYLINAQKRVTQASCCNIGLIRQY